MIKKVFTNQTLDKRLGSLIAKADSIVSVFTDMVQDLKSTNEELALVLIESEKIAEQHKNMAENVKSKILANESTIKKIESIIG